MEILTKREVRLLTEVIEKIDCNDELLSILDKLVANNEELKARPSCYDWDKAPEWAQWAVIDEDNDIWYCEKRPIPGEWSWVLSCRYSYGGAIDYPLWGSTLEQRPSNIGGQE